MAREITYNNFEISLVVFMPNITTNHAITYTNHRIRGLLFHFKKIVIFIGFYFFGKSIQKHPDSVCESDVRNTSWKWKQAKG